jgi:hypothetical protein
MSGPGMTSFSNKFCEFADHCIVMARMAPIASAAVTPRLNPILRSMEMRGNNVNDGHKYEDYEQRHA